MCIKNMKNTMMQIAHRGDSQTYGDNNLVSFLSALHKKYDMIELDVQLCKTGQVVVHHDIFIQADFIKNYTLDELRRFDIITLDEFLQHISIDDIRIFLDLKGHESVIYPIMSILREQFTEMQMARIYISSFNNHFVKPLQESKLPVNIGFTTYNSLTNTDWKWMIKYCDFVCIHWTTLNRDTIQMLKEYVSVFVFTCDNDNVRRHIEQHPVDGIVTNYLLWKEEPLRDAKSS